MSRKSTLIGNRHRKMSEALTIAPVHNIVHSNACQIPTSSLLVDNQEILARYSPGGNKFTRWLHELNLISINNPLTQRYFRSETAVNNEKIRHIQLDYWYIVHPLSKLRVYFEIWQLVLYLFLVTVKPMFAGAPTSTMMKVRFFPEICTILDLLSWVTIILTFFNGYINKNTRTMVLEPKRIAWNYISSVYFTCDVLSSIPLYPMIHICIIIFKTRILIGLGVLYTLCELRLIRIVSIIQYINNLAVYFRIKSKENVFLLMCVIVTLFTVHNSALLQLLVPKLIKGYFARGHQSHRKWFIKNNLHKKAFSIMYTHSVFRSSAYILAVRLDMYKDDNEPEDYVLAIVTYILGKIIICTTYVILAVTLVSNESMKVKFHSIIDQLDEYMTKKQLPLNLRDRIKKYYNFKYQGKYFKEDKIHDMLSTKLKTDVDLHICRSLVESVSIFADLTAEQISNVVTMLKPEIFLPKDTVFQSGSYGDSMYFISSGTVAIYTYSGREICHLEDGAYFGEIAVVLKIPHRCATVIAIETTQVFVLKRKDFTKSLLKNPEVMEKILKMAYFRFSKIRELDEAYRKMLFEHEHGAHNDYETER